jgi:antitoxin component YwqK of YwqJK toxin-antitoxin module
MTKTLIFVALVFAAASLAGCGSSPHKSALASEFDGSGKLTEFHANGKVKRKATFLDGELVSAASYYASGVEESDEQYELGKIHSATYYFSNGRVKASLVGD